jgi:hypothetical protein
MNSRYQASSKRARSALAIAALLVSLLGAVGIDGLATGYHGEQGTQAAAKMSTPAV